MSNNYSYDQSPFYKLITKAKLAKLLCLNYKDLIILQKLTFNYRKLWLHKETKKWHSLEPNSEEKNNFRPIDLPPEKLKLTLKRISNLLGRIILPDNIFSPVKGRSYIDNAFQHLGSKAFYSVDIENYFTNTRIEKIVGFFKNQMKCSIDVSTILARIVTRDGFLPQGSPCSPILAYFANKPMWDSITQLCRDHNCKATIYADDLTISGDVILKSLAFDVNGIIKKYGMKINPKKIKSAYKKPVIVTGIVVSGNKILLPNRQHLLIKNTENNLAHSHDKKEKDQLKKSLQARKVQKKQIEKLCCELDL